MQSIALKNDLDHVWHPFTQMATWPGSSPLVISKGEGNFLIDESGKRYLDGMSSLWVNVHGHGRPELVEAISRQAATLAHSTLLGLANEPSANLAARLAQLTGLPKVFYSDSGSSAVEIALKIAFQYWQHVGLKDKVAFAHLRQAYHGDTLGAVGVGGIPLFHEVYGPIIMEGIPVRSPAPQNQEKLEEASGRAIQELEAILAEQGHSIAAFVLEPLVQGAAGILVHSPSFLKEAKALCEKHQVLFIADEVATGFGRTGSMFAFEKANITPDLLCLAKGITGGTLPLAATLSTQKIFEAFLGSPESRKTFFHGHTYTGNPIACAAAIASLDIFRKEDVIANLPPTLSHFSEELLNLAHPCRDKLKVRHEGLMAGVELQSPHLAARICSELRQDGVMLRPLGPVVVIMPPLSIQLEEISLLFSALDKRLDAL